MKETPARYARRTGASYAPAPELSGLGQPLGPGDPCPTLFRYPSPQALQSLLHGGLKRLGPPDSPWTYLSDAFTRIPSRASVARFGAAAVLQPLRLGVVKTEKRGEYLGLNRPLDPAEAIWVPPSAASADTGWDRIASPEQALKRFGKGYASELAQVQDELGRYLEELALLSKAGAPGPDRPWVEVSARERARLLGEYGVGGKWTARR